MKLKYAAGLAAVVFSSITLGALAEKQALSAKVYFPDQEKLQQVTSANANECDNNVFESWHMGQKT